MKTLEPIKAEDSTICYASLLHYTSNLKRKYTSQGTNEESCLAVSFQYVKVKHQNWKKDKLYIFKANQIVILW